MKLYDVPRNTNIRLSEDAHIPPSALPVNKGALVKFIKLDGMYSWCKNTQDQDVYIGACTEVEIV